MKRLLVVAGLSLFLVSVRGRAEGTASSAIPLVEERTVDLLHGGASAGPRRMAVAERSDAWCRAWLSPNPGVVERIEADPNATTGNPWT